MRLYTVTIELGVDDSLSEEKVRERLNSAIVEDFPEAKLFRINDVKITKVASGQYRLNIDEARRLGLSKI